MMPPKEGGEGGGGEAVVLVEDETGGEISHYQKGDALFYVAGTGKGEMGMTC
ncbi:MAG: hypothetical protein U5L72_02790 [Bacteroidales bacterium]|nr:hypothetical protein [Bacteroidales bacterium]